MKHVFVREQETLDNVGWIQFREAILSFRSREPRIAQAHIEVGDERIVFLDPSDPLTTLVMLEVGLDEGQPGTKYVWEAHDLGTRAASYAGVIGLSLSKYLPGAFKWYAPSSDITDYARVLGRYEVQHQNEVFLEFLEREPLGYPVVATFGIEAHKKQQEFVSKRKGESELGARAIHGLIEQVMEGIGRTMGARPEEQNALSQIEKGGEARARVYRASHNKMTEWVAAVGSAPKRFDGTQPLSGDPNDPLAALALASNLLNRNFEGNPSPSIRTVVLSPEFEAVTLTMDSLACFPLRANGRGKAKSHEDKEGKSTTEYLSESVKRALDAGAKYVAVSVTMKSGDEQGISIGLYDKQGHIETIVLPISRGGKTLQLDEGQPIGDALNYDAFFKLPPRDDTEEYVRQLKARGGNESLSA